MSAAEGMSEASSPEQAKRVSGASERTDERVAQYLRVDSRLFQTIVHRVEAVYLTSFITDLCTVE